jgi:hypothetical protein
LDIPPVMLKYAARLRVSGGVVSFFAFGMYKVHVAGLLKMLCFDLNLL